MPPHFFSLNDYNEIILASNDNGFSYKIDDTVIQLIKQLENDLGIQNISTSNYTVQNHKSTNFSSNPSSSNYKKNRVSSRKDSDIDKSWHQPPFKTTVLEKKEGTLMGDIRAYLNKMSVKNYDVNRNLILNLIKNKTESAMREPDDTVTDTIADTTVTEISVNAEKTDTILQIANNIFDIASTNKFYSEMYANLYKSLAQEFSIFNDILMNFLSTYTETMKNIQYINPNENYDLFCDYNKKNDMRKATTMFIINLIKNKTLSSDILFVIFDEIIAFLILNIEKEGHVNEVEEITENISLLVGNFCTLLKGTTQMKLIEEISTWKSKDKPSLSSRSVFKFMDMMDSIKKNV